jgi:hypothetical protein
MKPIELQLITVKLENGQHGIFVGTPLIQNPSLMQDNQVSEIWFSDVRGLPENMPLEQLIELVKAQLCGNRNTMH